MNYYATKKFNTFCTCQLFVHSYLFAKLASAIARVESDVDENLHANKYIPKPNFVNIWTCMVVRLMLYQGLRILTIFHKIV